MTPRRARLLVLLVVVAGAGLLIAAGLQHTLTFYRTPTEVLRGPAAQRVRLGGEVVPGSLRTSGGLTRFQISDGTSRVEVAEVADLPGTIREGQEAVVVGALDGQGVFRSDTVMAKHGNEYRPAAPGAGGSG